jgi:hypothetical protein
MTVDVFVDHPGGHTLRNSKRGVVDRHRYSPEPTGPNSPKPKWQP